MIENNEVKFPMGSVPISIVAKVYGKDPNWVRAGIIGGWLPIGTATRRGQLVTDISERKEKLGRITYFVSPRRLYEETGYLWEGNDNK